MSLYQIIGDDKLPYDEVTEIFFCQASATLARKAEEIVSREERDGITIANGREFCNHLQLCRSLSATLIED